MTNLEEWNLDKIGKIGKIGNIVWDDTNLFIFGDNQTLVIFAEEDECSEASVKINTTDTTLAEIEYDSNYMVVNFPEIELEDIDIYTTGCVLKLKNNRNISYTLCQIEDIEDYSLDNLRLKVKIS